MPTLYAQRTGGGYFSYTGMSQAVVEQMWSDSGWSCTFIDQQTFDAATQII